jgi:hypothetical protein
MEKATLEQLRAVQEESRDSDLQLLWSMNLFLIDMIEALSKQLGFKFDFDVVMDQASEYVSDNFEELKVKEKEHDKFMTTMKRAYRGRSYGPRQ